MGLPAAGQDSTSITWSRQWGTSTEGDGGGDKKGVRGPQPRGAASGRPLPSRASAEGPGAPPALGNLLGGPGRGAGARAEVPAEESKRGGSPPRCPADHVRVGGLQPGRGRVGAGGAGEGRGVRGVRGWGGGPGPGRALHSPSCRRRRPRPRPARSRPPSTCSRRCPAPTGRRSRAASASAAAFSPFGRRPRPPLLASAAWGRRGRGEGRGRSGGRGRARRRLLLRRGLLLGRGESGARPAPELRPGPGARRGNRAGSGGLGGGQRVREQRATNRRRLRGPGRGPEEGITASPWLQHAGFRREGLRGTGLGTAPLRPPPRPLCVLSAAAPPPP